MRCSHCGEDAGRLKAKHQSCQTLHERGERRMTALATDAAISGQGAQNLRAELRAVADASYHSSASIVPALAKGYIKAAQTALEDHLLSEEE